MRRVRLSVLRLQRVRACGDVRLLLHGKHEQPGGSRGENVCHPASNGSVSIDDGPRMLPYLLAEFMQIPHPCYYWLLLLRTQPFPPLQEF